MFTMNGTLRLAKNTQFGQHNFQLKPRYLVNRVKLEEKTMVICQATDTTTNRSVDILKFSDIFRNNYGLSLLRQIQIYKAMKENRFIRTLVDIMIPTKLIEPGGGGEEEEEEIDFRDVYLVFNSMEDFEYLFADDEEEKEEEEEEEESSPYHVSNTKSLLLQLLNALHHLHMAGIVHGNLRPLNLVVSSDKKIMQLYNFDLAAPQVAIGELHEEEEDYHPTQMGYIPPEFMLGFTKYDTSADMWAVGCLFAQLLNQGTPLFLVPLQKEWSRKDFFDEVIKISRPTAQDFQFLPSEADKIILLQLLSALEEKEKQHLLNHLKEVDKQQQQHPLDHLTDDEASMHLLKGLLQFDPNKRLTVEEALKYFTQEEECLVLDVDDDGGGGLKNRIDALTATYDLLAEGIAPFNMTEAQIRSLIWKEMKSF